nr:MAG TPA: hypothetical protein [Caudoviricetes sp.]
MPRLMAYSLAGSSSEVNAISTVCAQVDPMTGLDVSALICPLYLIEIIPSVISPTFAW